MSCVLQFGKNNLKMYIYIKQLAEIRPNVTCDAYRNMYYHIVHYHCTISQLVAGLSLKGSSDAHFPQVDMIL